jgi:hypothetical protein
VRVPTGPRVEFAQSCPRARADFRLGESCINLEHHYDFGQHTPWRQYYGVAQGPQHSPSSLNMAPGQCQVDSGSAHHFRKNSSNGYHHRPLAQFHM